MEIPQSGGTFIRDMKTGVLVRQADATAETAPEAPPAAEAVEPASASPEIPADEAAKKKVK